MNYFKTNFKLLFVFICMLVINNYTSAQSLTSYYINANSGNDVNNGSISTPWRSLAKASTINWPQAGGTIYLDCNSTWRDQLNINTTANNITVASYGNCGNSKPTILGSNQVTGWKLYKTNIYYATVSASVSQVYVNGQFIRLARYPDDNSFLKISASTTSANEINTKVDGTPISCPAAQEEKFLNFASAGSCTVFDAALKNTLPVNDLVGAIFNLQTLPYWYDAKKIIDYRNAQGAFILDSKSRYPASIDSPNYYLENKLWMLEKGTASGWYYDSVTHRLYLRIPNGSSPSNQVVEATIRPYGIHNTGSTTTLISNVAIKYSQSQGILVESSRNVHVLSSAIEKSGGDGIVVYDAHDSVEISSNTISTSYHDAIKIIKSTTAATQISANTINDSGTVSANTGSPKYSLAAILAEHPEAPTNNSPPNGNVIPPIVISGNSLSNSAYAGIRSDSGSFISNNVVVNSCLVLSDCGSIYTWNGITSTKEYAYYETKILNNIVENDNNTTKDAYGIYLDDFTNRATVSGNTVIGGQYGIFLHLAFNNFVTNNTLYANTEYQLYISENLSSDYAYTVHDNIIDGNIFFGINDKENIRLYGEYGNIQFGTFNHNIYSALYSDPVISTSAKRYSFSAWQHEGLGIGMDKQGQSALKYHQIKSEMIVGVNSTNLIANNSFDNSTSNWTAWNAIISYQPTCPQNYDAEYGSVPTLGCAHGQNYNNSIGLLSSNLFPIKLNAYYWVSFAFISNAPTNVALRKSQYDYAPLGLNAPIYAFENRWQYFSQVFKATQTLNTAILQIDVPPSNGISIDNAYIMEVQVELNNLSHQDDSKVLLNKNPSQYQTLNCNSQTLPHPCNEYMDINGTPVQWPISLAPMGSKIIVWTNNPFTQAY